MNTNQKKIATQKELTGNHPQQMLFAEELTALKFLYPYNSTRQEIEHKFKNHIHEDLKLCLVDSYVENKYDGKKNKGATFHNQWQSFRVKKNQKVDYEARHRYEESGEYQIMVKVMGVFGTDTNKVEWVK
jgi:hypothetical protein